MKINLLIKVFILLICTTACANKNDTPTEDILSTTTDSITTNIVVTDSFKTGIIISKVVCKNDASQSYALYIPAKNDDKELPVIYFFDPHAKGDLPLHKYKALADKYNIILVSSNNSKNGNDWPTSEHIWSTLFNDSQKRLKINSNLIFTCGFSGGAKVASYIALHHSEIKSVIVGGAALPDGTIAGNFNFSYTIISGEGDMNMTDLVSTNNELDKTQTKHRILFFNGIHEWAPESTMNTAFEGLQLDAMQKQLIPKNAAFISNYIQQVKSAVNDYYNSGKLIKAVDECKIAISMLDGLTDEVNWFKEKETALQKNNRYQQQFTEQQNILLKENNTKAVYMQQFQLGNADYWGRTVDGLRARSKIANNETAMNQRLLAYLSLAFYSITNRMIASNDNNSATHFDELYKLADPTNSEAWYFSAIINARNNNAKATEDDLLKAVANGFNNTQRMMQQPEFQQLNNQINFSKIAANMKN